MRNLFLFILLIIAAVAASWFAWTPLPNATVQPSYDNPLIPTGDPRLIMLDLINQARADAGSPGVTLGANNAAQKRAETMLRNCTFSHWDTNGLKPYMRYSLAGGYHPNAENIYSANECGLSDTHRQSNLTPQQMSAQAMTILMNSPSHRETIIDPLHQRVNIGLAWDKHTFKAVQHFESDHVNYTTPPTLEGNTLTLEGTLKQPQRFQNGMPPSAVISYDPPPKRLTRGQLSKTYCYDQGDVVAAVTPLQWNPQRRPYYQITVSHPTCLDPNSVAPDTELPKTRNDLRRSWKRNKSGAPTPTTNSVTIPILTTADAYVSQNSFRLSADLNPVLQLHGPGVYTVSVAAIIAGPPEQPPLIISEHSIFHLVHPP